MARLPFSRFSGLIEPLLGGAEVARWRGALLALNPGEQEGFYKYLLPDAPELEFDWLSDQCREAAVFADVGANEGFYAVALARAHPHLRVFAFEPDPRLAARIRRNVALNPEVVSRVTVVEAAAGAISGNGWFVPAPGANVGVGHLVDQPSGEATAVPVVALCGSFREAGVIPDVIKIDVEGAELDVWRGLDGCVAQV